MSTIPVPALFGTIGFAVGCIVILVVLKIIQLLARAITISLIPLLVSRQYLYLCTGKMSKDNTGIGFTVAIMSCISLWLLWLMAWFHQWHPLITPEYP